MNIQIAAWGKKRSALINPKVSMLIFSGSVTARGLKPHDLSSPDIQNNSPLRISPKMSRFDAAFILSVCYSPPGLSPDSGVSFSSRLTSRSDWKRCMNQGKSSGSICQLHACSGWCWEHAGSSSSWLWWTRCSRTNGPPCVQVSPEPRADLLVPPLAPWVPQCSLPGCWCQPRCRYHPTWSWFASGRCRRCRAGTGREEMYSLILLCCGF